MADGLEFVVPRVVTLAKTCGAFPAQWDGELDDGRVVYVRYRHGWLSIGAGATEDEAVDASFGLTPLLEVRVSEGSGEMELPQLEALTVGLLDFGGVRVTAGEAF